MDSAPIFEWDERKRRFNLRKHKFDFVDCPRVFGGPVLTVIDDRYDYGETRFRTLGLLRGSVVSVVHTEEHGIVRVISMRKATTHEETSYFEEALEN
jgi:uncharacterized protein